MNPGLETSYVLRGARFAGEAKTSDIAIRNGRIVAIQPQLPANGEIELDLEGRLVIPGFVDAHMHLDKAYALESGLVPGSSLHTAIQGFLRWRDETTPDQIYRNARRAAEQALLHGTLALRTHTTIDKRSGLSWLASLAQLKEEMAGRLTIQIVAFPDNELIASGEARKYLLEALSQGADLVGGAPSVFPDPQQAVDTLIEIAGEAGCDLDLHVDESDDPACNSLQYLAERKITLGFTGQVTAGHCCSLSAMDEATAQKIIEKVAQAQIRIITLPACNLYLMGRSDRGVIRRGLTRVREFLQAGVEVAYASDNIRDAFNPFGNGDMLQMGLIAAYALQMGTQEDLITLLKMGTVFPARIMGLQEYGLAVGNPATFVVLDDRDWGSALARGAPCRYVFSHGRLVAKRLIDQALQ